MIYRSTRGGESLRSASYVIKTGIAADGGLFVPDTIPVIDERFIKELSVSSYAERATKVLSRFLSDFSAEELFDAASIAYSLNNFGGNVAPITKAGNNYILELWHGPTSAFKDMALQIMPRLLSLSLDKCDEEKDALILVATSGDTGKAALEGYKDVPRVRIQVFYPSEGVSRMQKLQMATQEGTNISVCAINGNFDDAQTAVKRMFTSKDAAEALDKYGLFFSSANSINWGRLAPQIVYYISAYCDMLNDGTITMGDKINVTVPTGNFGNILAAYIAKKMGLPIGKLVCASNTNNILTDFFTKGVYDKRRPFFTTSSPSMDILLSSNLERLLYFTFGAERCRELMKKLLDEGFYSISKTEQLILMEDFVAGYCSEEQTSDTIKSYFDQGYLCDPHTAVALFCADEYVKTSGDKTPMLVASTASPYKFPQAVLKALGKVLPEDDFDCLALLNEVSEVHIPENLASLRDKHIRFSQVVDKTEMDDVVKKFAALNL